MGLIGQEITGYVHVTSGSNLETGRVLMGIFCSSNRLRNTLKVIS